MEGLSIACGYIYSLFPSETIGPGAQWSIYYAWMTPLDFSRVLYTLYSLEKETDMKID